MKLANAKKVDRKSGGATMGGSGYRIRGRSRNRYSR
jgi:hypothetical protein